MAKTSKGRQKIEMTKMSKESNLLVTFSKRRSGLFKKASELCTLCGVEIAILVFSPGKKAFSFGHPSVEAIVDKFLYKSSLHRSSGATPQLLEAHRNACVRELNVHLTEATNQLEVEKKQGDELSKMRKKPIQERCWWEGPISEMKIEQLEQLKLAMEELKRNVAKQAEKLHIVDHSNHPYPNSSAMPFYVPGLSTLGNESIDPLAEVKMSGLGMTMIPHGHAQGNGLGYGYGHGNRHEHGHGFY